MTVKFDTSEYERSHSHSPRGRGAWAFSTERDPDVLTDAVKWSPSMTYTEAKAWARRQFASTETVYVYVLS